MARVIERESSDVDDQAQALSGWRQSYEQLGRGRFRGSSHEVVMEQGVLLRETTNRPLREQIVPPDGHWVLAVPASVVPGSRFAGRLLEPDSLVALKSGAEYEMVAAGELDLVALSVHHDLLAGVLAPAEFEWLERAVAERSQVLSAPAAAALRTALMAARRDAAVRLAPAAGASPWPPANLAPAAGASVWPLPELAPAAGASAWPLPELAPEAAAAALAAAEAELLASTLARTVALAMAGDTQAAASSLPRRADTRLRVVRRAIDYMRAHLHDDIGIPEICEAACASRRSLQYCFEEFLHTSPQAYLRALRLNEARRALKLAADQPITQVACAYGFSSASHFTRHYKLMFDELPSQTLQLA